MQQLKFKNWLLEQQSAKQVVTPQDKILNAEIEKAIITAKAKGGTAADTMAPNVLANIVTPDLLRNQQVQKAIKDKLKIDTTKAIDLKKKEAERQAKTTQTASITPATVKSV